MPFRHITLCVGVSKTILEFEKLAILGAFENVDWELVSYGDDCCVPFNFTGMHQLSHIDEKFFVGFEKYTLFVGLEKYTLYKGSIIASFAESKMQSPQILFV